MSCSRTLITERSSVERPIVGMMYEQNMGACIEFSLSQMAVCTSQADNPTRNFLTAFSLLEAFTEGKACIRPGYRPPVSWRKKAPGGGKCAAQSKKSPAGSGEQTPALQVPHHGCQVHPQQTPLPVRSASRRAHRFKCPRTIQDAISRPTAGLRMAQVIRGASQFPPDHIGYKIRCFCYFPYQGNSP